MIIEGSLADMARNMGHPVFTHFFVRANRRWSMIGTRSEQREKLEGSPLNVCLDCKEMVLQVRYIWYFDYAVTRRYGLATGHHPRSVHNVLFTAPTLNLGFSE